MLIHGASFHNPHLSQYDENTKLNECEPINRPPYSLITGYNETIIAETNKLWKYERVIFTLWTIYADINNLLSLYNEFVSDIEITRRRNKYLVDALINPNLKRFTNRYLLEDYRETEFKKQLIIHTETFKSMLCDILWFVIENRSKNYENEMFSLKDNDFRTAIKKYQKYLKWFENQIQEINCGEVNNRKYIHFTLMNTLECGRYDILDLEKNGFL